MQFEKYMRRNRPVLLRNASRPKRKILASATARHTPKERPGSRMTEDRRDEIVRKAAALFIEKGYANVTIDEIIRLVGGSKATLYARFGGKEGLFETVIRQPCVDVTHSIDIEPNGDIETQLTHIARSFLKSVLDPKIIELHRLMVSIGKTFPAVGSFFYDSGPNTAYTIVAKWVAKQQAAGNLAGGNPRQLAVLFLDMLIGEHQLALLTSPRQSSPRAIDNTVRAAVSLFLRGAASRPLTRKRGR
jgi:TetR/AcrR family transcriptional regulator, mexJK operon transcriptional repressor